MKLIIIAGLIVSASAVALAQEKCFDNVGLKDGHEIRYTVSGKSVQGEFRVARDFDAMNAEVYPFTGTVAGTTLSIRFSGEAPDSLPVSPATKRWTLSSLGLRVTLYGKNYNTGKWSNYTVDYKNCQTPYERAVSTATRVSFARGTTSATFDVNFTAKGQQRSYLVNMRSGQHNSVTAPGCGISFFYPDKKPYEEGTAIDTWGTDSLPQTGDYLFVISPAGEPGTCNVRFEAR